MLFCVYYVKVTLCCKVFCQEWPYTAEATYESARSLVHRIQPQSIAYTDGCLHAGLAFTSSANSCLQPTSSSGFRRHHTSQSRTHHLPITQAICKHAPLHLLKHQHRPHHRPGRPKALVSCHASLTFYPATHPASHCCISSGC